MSNADYLIDTTDPICVGAKVSNVPNKVNEGEIVIWNENIDQPELGSYPIFGFTFWNQGAIINDGLGNVYPDLISARGTIGSRGVAWSNVKNKDGSRNLDFTGYLEWYQACNQIRVDQLIGTMPKHAEKNKAAYVDWANKLKNKDLLLKLMRDAQGKLEFQILEHNFKPKGMILYAIAEAKNEMQKKRYEAASEKAEKGYQEWLNLLLEVKKEFDSEPLIIEASKKA